MRRRTALLLAVLAGSAVAQQPDTVHRVHVPLHDGALQVDELVKELLAAYELDATDVPLPTTRVDVRGAAGSLLLWGGRKLLLDTVRFHRDFAASQLVVTIDRERARDVRRELRKRMATFAARLAGEEVAERRYELELPANVDAARPLIVLVHGVESSTESMADLRSFLAAPPRCCQVVSFGYPDDEAIDRIAAEFSRRLRALGAQAVAIVAHSMGGLVARAAIEDPALDPGNVRTLVTIGTPHAGSNLAGLRIALETAQVVGGVNDPAAIARELVDGCIEHWRDGLGEAGGDLTPGSVFLRQLAARQRNPKVEYHVVVGTASVLEPTQLDAVRTAALRHLPDDPIGKLVRPRLEAWLADLDELVDGEGDGAVSVAAGALEGVEPVRVPLDHLALVRERGLLGRRIPAAEHPVFALVAAWVGSPK